MLKGNDHKLALSVPLSEAGYLRSFEAEIDVLSENELLLRGRMKDHRFALEHVWTLRTPDYEVVEATARQSAGDKDQFSPELCARTPLIPA